MVKFLCTVLHHHHSLLNLHIMCWSTRWPNFWSYHHCVISEQTRQFCTEQHPWQELPWFHHDN